MTTKEFKDKLVEVSRWFSRATAMVTADEKHTCATPFTKAARACCAEGNAELTELATIVGAEGVPSATEPVAPTEIAPMARRYVDALLRGGVKYTLTSPKPEERHCYFYRGHPADHVPDEELGSATGASEVAVVLGAFLDVLTRCELSKGDDLVLREEEDDDDGE